MSELKVWDYRLTAKKNLTQENSPTPLHENYQNRRRAVVAGKQWQTAQISKCDHVWESGTFRKVDDAAVQ